MMSNCNKLNIPLEMIAHAKMIHELERKGDLDANALLRIECFKNSAAKKKNKEGHLCLSKLKTTCFRRSKS